MKHCKKFEELISAYVDGELDSSDKLLLEEHLRSCPSCLNLLALYHGMSVSMRESCVEAPPSLSGNVMDVINNPDTARIVTPSFPDEIDKEFEARAKKRKVIRAILTRYAPIAACLAIALLVLPQFLNLNRSYNEAAPMPPAPAAIPEMAYDDMGIAEPFGAADEAMEFAVSAEEETDEALADAAPPPPSEAPRAISEDYADVPTPTERGNGDVDEEQPHTPAGDTDIEWGQGGWTMNDSLLEPEYVATAGYYAFIMIEHEFTDTFPLIAYLSDYYLLEQNDVARFIEEHENHIVYHIPGDANAAFALIQFVW